MPDIALPTPSHPLLDRLWRDYVRDVPAVGRFVDVAGPDAAVENDHIALRTVANDGPGSGLAVFVPVFERLGWQVKDAYAFDDVHLTALYLAQQGLPRIFVSELDATAFSPAVAAALRRGSDRTTPPDVVDVDQLALWFSAPHAASRADVDLVGAVSQYGAWCLCFGRRVNHFTAVVDDVAHWQQRLVAAGVPMKPAIEGAPIPTGGIGLRQTATAAADVEVVFADGSTATRPYAYFEIAERKGGFDGFLAQQARQLFDQTGR